MDKAKEEKYLEALEIINKAYDNAGLNAQYTPEMSRALTGMKITLLANVLTNKSK